MCISATFAFSPLCSTYKEFFLSGLVAMMHKAFWILLEKNRMLGRDTLSSLHGPQTGLTLSRMTFGAFLHCRFPGSPRARPIPGECRGVHHRAGAGRRTVRREGISRDGLSSLISRSAGEPAPSIQLLWRLDLYPYLPLGLPQRLLRGRARGCCGAVPSGPPLLLGSSLSGVRLSSTRGHCV